MKPTIFGARKGALPLAGVLLLLSLLTHCSRKPEPPPPEVVARYQAHAGRLCEAIVDCMKEEVRERLARQPERRDLVLARMDRDLCLKEQYALIGEISVDPTPAAAPYREEHYRLYEACADAVTKAATCEERRDIHRTDTSCVRLRAMTTKEP